jgi:xanthine dehydrogenase accessory factor
MIEDRRVLEKLNESLKNNRSVATVTIVESSDFTPRGTGSMMLVDEEGVILEGTIGGGLIEETARQDAVNCLLRNESKLISYTLNENSKNDNALPMACGGNASLFIKVYNSQDKLIIAGGGHIAVKLAAMAHILGYSISILDNREERLNDQLFPQVDNLILGNIADTIKDISIDKNTYIIIVTHGHKFDQDVLEAVIESKARYIGMIGSKKKVNTVFKSLLEKGYDKEKISKVYSPIGLDLGGETPEEISLSILAEMQAVKYAKDAPYLYKNRWDI